MLRSFRTRALPACAVPHRRRPRRALRATRRSWLLDRRPRVRGRPSLPRFVVTAIGSIGGSARVMACACGRSPRGSSRCVWTAARATRSASLGRRVQTEWPRARNARRRDVAGAQPPDGRDQLQPDTRRRPRPREHDPAFASAAVSELTLMRVWADITGRPFVWLMPDAAQDRGSWRASRERREQQLRHRSAQPAAFSARHHAPIRGGGAWSSLVSSTT